jgi:hypothetical protein
MAGFLQSFRTYGAKTRTPVATIFLPESQRDGRKLARHIVPGSRSKIIPSWRDGGIHRPFRTEKFAGSVTSHFVAG